MAAHEAQDSPRRGRPEAARAVWQWQQAKSASVHQGLRREGIIRGIVGLSIAAAFFAFGHRTLATIVATIGSLTLLAVLISPRGAYLAIHRFTERLGEWIGRLIGWLLLPLIFFVIFLPLAWILRLQKKDSLHLSFDTDAPSYWHHRDDADRQASFYERQF